MTWSSILTILLFSLCPLHCIYMLIRGNRREGGGCCGPAAQRKTDAQCTNGDV